MPPALRKGPVSPARAAAVPASPPGSKITHRSPGALALESAPGTCLPWGVAR